MARFRTRRKLRLPQDYSATGAYYVTICAHTRGEPFGHTADGAVCLNEVGLIVARTWRWLPLQYPHVVLDEWCVMPDHLHGIVVLTDHRGSRTPEPAVARKPLGQLIGAFKTVSTKEVNIVRNTPGHALWQGGFWDHIVRDEADMIRIRAYIRRNPLAQPR